MLNQIIFKNTNSLKNFNSFEKKQPLNNLKNKSLTQISIFV